jgi:uncharacterized protein (TIGR01732 family)
MSAFGGAGFFGTSTAIILVLFILIAIVGRSGNISGFGGGIGY